MIAPMPGGAQASNEPQMAERGSMVGTIERTPDPVIVRLATAIRGRLDTFLTRSPLRIGIGLGARFVLARLLSGGSLLIAASFVNIEAFAEFGVYLALVNVLWITVFLRYEAAVVGAASTGEAQAAIRLCAAVALGVSAAVALVSAAVTAGGLVSPALGLLFPLALAARAGLRLSVVSGTREGDFRGLGRVALVQSLIQPAVLVALSINLDDGALAFAAADVAGHAAAALYLWFRQRGPLLAALGGGWSRQAVFATARKWSSLPLVNLPGSVLSHAFLVSPLIILPLVAGPTMAGHFALAMRLFDIPTQIIAAVGGSVLLNHLSPASASARLFGRRMLLLMVVTAVAIYGMLATGLLVLDPWLAGTFLEGLAPVVPLVALFQAFAALSSPLGEACSIYAQQRRLVMIHAAALAGVLAAVAVGFSHGPRTGMTVLAIVSIGRTIAFGERLRALSNSGAFLERMRA